MYDGENLRPVISDEERRDSLTFAMERGDLLVVRYLIRRHGGGTCARLLPQGHLDAWLAEAEAHEAANGPGSFLEAEHRFNAELLPYLDRQADGEVLTPADLPAPRWCMDRGWHRG